MSEKLIICGTGHRPASLPSEYGYDYNSEGWLKIRADLKAIISELKPDYIITGMALGFDQVLALVAIEMNIKLYAAVPCRNQCCKWTNESKKLYKYIISKCIGYKIISEEYTNKCMQDRNEWMVDHSNIVIAMFNGNPGGTKNCVEYAKKNNKRIINIIKEK